MYFIFLLCCKCKMNQVVSISKEHQKPSKNPKGRDLNGLTDKRRCSVKPQGRKCSISWFVQRIKHFKNFSCSDHLSAKVENPNYQLCLIMVLHYTFYLNINNYIICLNWMFLIFLFKSNPARHIFPSWDEPDQPVVVTSKLHLPESSASASPTSWLPVTRHEELATDRHGKQQVRKCTQLWGLWKHYIASVPMHVYLNEILSHALSVTCCFLRLFLCAAACSVSQDRVQGRPLASRGFTTTWASPSPWPEVQVVSVHYLPWGSPLAWATVTSATWVQCAATSRLVTLHLQDSLWFTVSYFLSILPLILISLKSMKYKCSSPSSTPVYCMLEMKS